MSRSSRKGFTLTGQVGVVLGNNKDSRNNDYILWSEVCEEFYPKFERPVKNYREMGVLMSNLPSLSEISRARRIVVAKTKEYKPSDPKVLKSRKRASR